jgi:hypothetical protein
MFIRNMYLINTTRISLLHVFVLRYYDLEHFFCHLRICFRVGHLMIASLYLLIQISAIDLSFPPWRGVFSTNLFDQLDKVWECLAYVLIIKRRVWRYRTCSQNPEIEGQTTQWPTEKGQKDKQRSIKSDAEIKKRLKISMWVIRICKLKRDRQYNGEPEKRQTMMDKTLHRKLKMEQDKTY